MKYNALLFGVNICIVISSTLGLAHHALVDGLPFWNFVFLHILLILGGYNIWGSLRD